MKALTFCILTSPDKQNGRQFLTRENLWHKDRNEATKFLTVRDAMHHADKIPHGDREIIPVLLREIIS